MSMEQTSPPVVDPRRGVFERLATLEARMEDCRKDITTLQTTNIVMADKLEKISSRVTLATGIIVGVSVALKVIPPDVGELLKHAIGG